MPLNESQLRRYARQLALKEFTVEKQERLISAHVAILGSGLSAELCTLYLAASGIGRIILVAGKDAESTASRVKALNPDTNVTISNEIPCTCDYIIDFTMNAESPDYEKIAAHVLDGTPLIAVIIRGWFSIVKKYQPDDPCPSCLAAALNKTREPDAHFDPGIAGPAAAAMALGEIAGYAAAPHEALLLDASAGKYDLLKITPSDVCGICGLFKKTG